MTGIPTSLENVSLFLETEMIFRWALGVALATSVWLVLRRYSHFLILPTAIAICVAVFYFTAFFSGFTLESLYQGNWLIGPLPNETLFVLPQLENFTNADWNLILSLFPQFCVLVIVTIIALLLCASSLEFVVKQDIDLNLELKAAGLGSTLCALFGTTTGYSAFGGSVISHKMGARSRWVGVLTAMVCVAVIFYGPMTLALIPKAVTGGIVLFIGFDLFYDWTIGSWAKFTTSEKLIIAAVTLVVVLVGFLEGVALGIFSGLFLFVVDYSQTNIIRFAVDASTFRSNVDRAPELSRDLSSHGPSISILKLQGYIFFGTANTLYMRVKERAFDDKLDFLKALIVDFHSVTGSDSSAIQTFSKMALLAEQENFCLILSGMSSHQRQLFEGCGVSEKHFSCVSFFSDLDYAMEWAEDILLKDAKKVSSDTPISLETELKRVFPNSMAVPKLLRYLQKVEFNRDDVMITQNESSRELFFIESGEVSVNLKVDSSNSIKEDGWGLYRW